MYLICVGIFTNLKTWLMLLVVKHHSAQEPAHQHGLAVRPQDGRRSVRLAGLLILTVVLRRDHTLPLSPLMACLLEHPTDIRHLPIAPQTFPLNLLPLQA